MGMFLLALIFFGLIVYGLERNHARQVHFDGHLAGSTDAEDRDTARVLAELRAR
ncbi:MAG: hypothetical protein ICV72_10565 [Aldersonia sp.]|nr:hypothetical protein [Aldersonia sp.]